MTKNNALVNFSCSTQASESYRILRSNLLSASTKDRPIKSILVTGSQPKDGKTTVACNLAISFAVDGYRVLLVDGDLRRPKIHDIFNIDNSSGLSDILEDKTSIDSKLYKNKLFENLRVLPSGTLSPYPSELLSSKKMLQSHEYIKNLFDFIIFDSPSLGKVPDAQIISGFVDGTVLVVSSDKTKIKSFKNALYLLEMSNATLLGTVLNNYGRNSKYYYTRLKTGI